MNASITHLEALANRIPLPPNHVVETQTKGLHGMFLGKCGVIIGLTFSSFKVQAHLDEFQVAAIYNMIRQLGMSSLIDILWYHQCPVRSHWTLAVSPEWVKRFEDERGTLRQMPVDVDSRLPHPIYNIYIYCDTITKQFHLLLLGCPEVIRPHSEVIGVFARCFRTEPAVVVKKRPAPEPSAKKARTTKRTIAHPDDPASNPSE